MMTSKVCVYVGCSVDGYIAGPGEDLSFLERAQQDNEGKMPGKQEGETAIQYEDFIARVGVLLMGRKTYDVVKGFGGDWPYGALPVRVATTRPLLEPPASVEVIQGSLAEMITEAKSVAQGKDIYLDGGALIRQMLDAGLVDELIVTMLPIILGQGVPLFAGVTREHLLTFDAIHRFNQKSMQWVARLRT